MHFVGLREATFRWQILAQAVPLVHAKDEYEAGKPNHVTQPDGAAACHFCITAAKREYV
jgi:hypothetical protein